MSRNLPFSSKTCIRWCPAVHDEEPAVRADRDAVDGVPLVRARVLRILGRPAPVHDELVVGVELRDARPAVPVGDEVRPVGQPGDVRRAIEGVRAPSPDAELAVREHELAVIGELVDDVKLVVENPHVLLFVVRADLDLVRTAAAGQLLEQLVLVLPLVNHVALPVEDDDRMLEPALPSAFVGRLAGGAEAVGVARRIPAGREERRVRRPGLGVLGERQLTAHGDPDPIGAFGIHPAERSPGPPGVGMTRVRQRLGPVSTTR